MTEHDLHDEIRKRKNVIGVYRDVDDGTLTAIVSQKVSEDELDESDLVSQAVDEPTQVVDAGKGRESNALDPLLLDPDAPIEAYSDRHEEHRPVEPGVSEMNSQGTAATSGPWPVRVTDTTAGEWSPDTSEGDLVRLSNAHVYSRSGQADFGEPILQPSPSDGGTSDNESGVLAGYAELADGATADVAARTSSVLEERSPHELPDEWPTGVIRDNYAELAGEKFRKSGRTTGVTKGTLRGVGASVNVRYPHGVVTLRDLLIFEDISDGGDSGSPVYTPDGEIVGLLFAGSQTITAVCSAANVEAELGVEMLTEVPDDPEPDTPDENQPIAAHTEAVLSRVFADGNATIDAPHTYQTGRSVDYHVDTGEHTFAVEVLESMDDYPSGLGQTLLYADYEDNATGVLVVPDDPDLRDTAPVHRLDHVHVVHRDDLRAFFDAHYGDGS